MVFEFRVDLRVHKEPDQDLCMYVFFFNDTATTEIYTLSLHDALPILPWLGSGISSGVGGQLSPAAYLDTWIWA